MTVTQSGSRGAGSKRGVRNIEFRRERRKFETGKKIAVVTMMIERYCRGVHRNRKGALCAECRELADYVALRRSKCPFGDEKPFCSNCKIHCYRPEMREKIHAVMRYAGPRIVFSHPIVAARHLMERKKQEKKMAKEAENDVG